ncbi:cupin domain-containing protein [Azospirillum soli]|uniref:cupin domain-containing protein n=1 Tax=Azospirillum soli TaxID=1304799 RepID=UPI001AE87BA6|nr:cupin domain-containing protein [Azospirillum soli]MBP2315698.1 quercetin dioxygenase-like cupin family protein [Azospirillum soli]
MRGARVLQNIATASETLKQLDWTSYDQPGRSGVQIHPLYDTSDTGPGGPAAALVRYLPGARVLRHRHPGYELIYVLEGELVNDSGRHGPGTLEVCPPDSSHALWSDTGCVFLVVWEQPVEPDRLESERLHRELLTEHGS